MLCSMREIVSLLIGQTAMVYDGSRIVTSDRKQTWIRGAECNYQHLIPVAFVFIINATINLWQGIEQE